MGCEFCSEKLGILQWSITLDCFEHSTFFAFGYDLWRKWTNNFRSARNAWTNCSRCRARTWTELLLAWRNGRVCRNIINDQQYSPPHTFWSSEFGIECQ